MSRQAFELMLALSRTLEHDHIDEDIGNVEIGRGRSQRTVTNRVINVRGKLDGRAVVVSFHNFYFLDQSARSLAHLRDIVEVFVAEQRLYFEGECRQRGVLDNIGRWFGGGGLRGPAPIFESCRIDGAPADAPELARDEFCRRLAELCRRPACVKVLLQADTGITGLFHAADVMRSGEQLSALLRACAELAAA